MILVPLYYCVTGSDIFEIGALVQPTVDFEIVATRKI